jgi:aspartyl-tRNA(Asn)/glutamyl-tRNA(Gln) amidotransferase subunit A
LLDFEVIGPIARDVADVRLLFEALRGPHAGDYASFAAAAPRPSFAPGLRVLYVPTLDDAPVDPCIAVACLQATERLQSMGHAVTVGAMPIDVSLGTTDWPQVGQIGMAWLFARHPRWQDGASEKYRAMARAGAQVPAHRLWQLLAQTARLRSDAARLFTQFDLVVTPATAALPWAADQAYPDSIDGRPVGPRGHGIFTAWVNAAGLPAVAVPCQPSADGLPTGVQMIGAYGCEIALLQCASAFEATAAQAWQWPRL